MPIYEYECKYCKYTFEALQNINAKKKRKCPECKKKNALKILIGNTSFVLSGDGWTPKHYDK